MCALAVIMWWLVSGCVWYNSALFVDSPEGPAGNAIACDDKTYFAHAGQPAVFTFEIEGPADYAEVYYSEQAPPDTVTSSGEGYFKFRTVFERPTAPDSPVLLEAVAYLIRGRQDRMFVDGEAIVRKPSDDVPDRKVAGTTVKVYVYQSEVAIDIPPVELSSNWAAARLVIETGSGRSSTVYLAEGSTRGFTVIGPDEQGAYVVRYRPRYHEIDPRGRNRAIFSARDRNGQLRKWETPVSTFSCEN
jgi:hypothetical protein